jgi:glyoxalase family protein
MRLEGIHHVTCITGDILKNVDFYTRVLGLRLVGKSVNQDDPFVYHVFYSDEEGKPGADLTFFEYPHAVQGRAGGGMVHQVVWRVASPAALDFWERRLTAEQASPKREGDRLTFVDPEGLGHQLVIPTSADTPLIADHPEIPSDVALQGFEGVRAYSRQAERSRPLLEGVMAGKSIAEATWEMRGERRGGWIAYDPAPTAPGQTGGGTVHHVAWGTTVAEHPLWLDHLRASGVSSTPVIDRHYFHSIYFREPSGVLFEIADDGPGFARDGTVAELGRKLILPPWFESQRADIESRLTPIPDPRASWAGRT